MWTTLAKPHTPVSSTPPRLAYSPAWTTLARSKTPVSWTPPRLPARVDDAGGPETSAQRTHKRAWSLRPRARLDPDSTPMGILQAHEHECQGGNSATPRMGGTTAHPKRYSTVPRHTRCERLKRSPAPALPFLDGVNLQSTITTCTTIPPPVLPT